MHAQHEQIKKKMLPKGLNLLATTRLDCSVETTNVAWASKFDETHCGMMRVRKKDFS